LNIDVSPKKASLLRSCQEFRENGKSGKDNYAREVTRNTKIPVVTLFIFYFSAPVY